MHQYENHINHLLAAVVEHFLSWPFYLF